MTERDVAWSIPTYFAFDRGGALDRLINWVGGGLYADCPDEMIELAAITVSWAFTSPNRRMRDYATKALSKLMAGRLSLLPKLIERFEGLNDPYVIERLSSVTYGAVISGGEAEPASAVASAEAIKHIALAEDQIPNALARDSVRGVFEWCAQKQLVEQNELLAVLPPYGAEPPDTPRSLDVLKSTYDKESIPDEDLRWPYSELFSSIFGFLGDFGRYVIDSKLSDFSPTPLGSTKRPIGRVPIYPSELGRAWVFERVLSLGWTPSRFAYFDKNEVTDYSGRGTHKAERFGKKYQWIALNELIARVSDNFEMTTGMDGQYKSYKGPWQSFGRDIDPTLPPPLRFRNENDELRLGETFSSDDEPWWIPLQLDHQTNTLPFDENWAVQTGDIPDLESLVNRTDGKGMKWVALHNHDNSQEDVPGEGTGRSRRRRSMLNIVFSWLVSHDDREKLKDSQAQGTLWKGWMPEDRELTDTAYLGELPWAAAADEYPDTWQAFRLKNESSPEEIDVYPTWATYFWEGNVLDCSINDGVRARFPAPILFDAGQLRWIPGTRKWCTPDGTMVAQYRESGACSALLVREDWLRGTLEKTGQSIVFGRFGEKKLYQTEPEFLLVGDWTQVHDLASLEGADWWFTRSHFERRSIGQ